MGGSGRNSGGGLGPRLRKRLRWTFALPLLVLAILLQSDAVVKSTVMNLLAFGADAAAPCPMGAGPIRAAPVAMGAMNMGAVSMAPPRAPAIKRQPPAKAPGSHTPCSYCAAAAHTPILTTTAFLRPSCAVAFTAFRTATLRGPRGPPPVQPRARGPPLTA